MYWSDCWGWGCYTCTNTCNEGAFGKGWDWSFIRASNAFNALDNPYQHSASLILSAVLINTSTELYVDGTTLLFPRRSYTSQRMYAIALIYAVNKSQKVTQIWFAQTLQMMHLPPGQFKTCVNGSRIWSLKAQPMDIVWIHRFKHSLHGGGLGIRNTAINPPGEYMASQQVSHAISKCILEKNWEHSTLT